MWSVVIHPARVWALTSLPWAEPCSQVPHTDFLLLSTHSHFQQLLGYSSWVEGNALGLLQPTLPRAIFLRVPGSSLSPSLHPLPAMSGILLLNGQRLDKNQGPLEKERGEWLLRGTCHRAPHEFPPAHSHSQETNGIEVKASKGKASRLQGGFAQEPLELDRGVPSKWKSTFCEACQGLQVWYGHKHGQGGNAGHLGVGDGFLGPELEPS